MTATKYLLYLLPTGTNCECLINFAGVKFWYLLHIKKNAGPVRKLPCEYRSTNRPRFICQIEHSWVEHGTRAVKVGGRQVLLLLSIKYI
jgi:hypothetical protein